MLEAAECAVGIAIEGNEAAALRFLNKRTQGRVTTKSSRCADLIHNVELRLAFVNTSSLIGLFGAWADYCRHPLIWLGLPDPATALLEQIRHDPDSDALGALMTEWRNAFGSTPTAVRKAVDAALKNHPHLLDALREFPIEERGEINRPKLGWLLKKNANRIVDGFDCQEAEADGRNAWKVMVIKRPTFPASIPSIGKTFNG